MHSWKYII